MSTHWQIGAVIYPGMDQIDFTGPFEVLSQLVDSTFRKRLGVAEAGEGREG